MGETTDQYSSKHLSAETKTVYGAGLPAGWWKSIRRAEVWGGWRGSGGRGCVEGWAGPWKRNGKGVWEDLWVHASVKTLEYEFYVSCDMQCTWIWDELCYMHLLYGSGSPIRFRYISSWCWQFRLWSVWLCGSFRWLHRWVPGWFASAGIKRQLGHVWDSSPGD